MIGDEYRDFGPSDKWVTFGDLFFCALELAAIIALICMVA